MRSISRRGFLATSGAALGALPLVRSIDALAQVTNPVFRHGVASGDPLSDRVILWTRVTPTSARGGAERVVGARARSRSSRRWWRAARLQTGAARDFTVKVDAAGPRAGHHLLLPLRRRTASARPIGRTQDAAARERVARPPRRGVVLEPAAGLLQRLRLPRERADLDAVLHLGDYFYEYANKQYGDGTALGRMPAPDKEIVALQDYRERHAQYKADPDSQEIHRQHPFIVTWDDHEFANNTWSGGAENHNAGEKATGRRGAPPRCRRTTSGCRFARTRRRCRPRIYRTFRFGDLATLFMLDTRLVGRDQEVDARGHRGDRASPTRQLLGAAAGRLAGASSSSTSVRNNTRGTCSGSR